MIKWLFRLLGHQVHLLLILLMPCVMVGMLLTCVHLATSTSLARNALTDFLDNLFAGSITIEEIRWDSNPRHLRVFGASLLTPNGETVAQLPEVHAQIDLRALVKPRVRTASITVQNPTIDLDFRNGSFNLTEALTTEPGHRPLQAPPSDPFPLTLAGVDIRNANLSMTFDAFTIRMPQTEVVNYSLALGDIMRMDADALRVPQGSLNFQPNMFGFDPADKEALTIRAQDLVIEDVQWRDLGFEFQRASMRANNADFSIKNGGMVFNATYAGIPVVRWKALVNASIPAQFTPLEYFVGPLIDNQLNITMNAHGILGPEENSTSSINNRVQLNASPLKVAGISFDDARIDASILNRRVYLRELSIRGHQGFITIPSEDTMSPSWGFEDGKTRNPPGLVDQTYFNILDQQYNAKLLIRDIQLESLVSDLAPDLPPETLNEVQGVLQADLRAFGRLSDMQDAERLTDLKAFHTVDLQSLSIQRDPERGSIPTREVSLSGILSFQDNILSTQGILPLRLDQDTITLRDAAINLADPDLETTASVDIQVTSLDAYLKRFGVTQVGGGVQANFRLDGPLLSPKIQNGTLRLNRPRLLDLSTTDVEATFSYNNGWLNLGQVNVGGQFGSLRASGSVKLFDGTLTKPLSNPKLDLAVPQAQANLDILLRDLKLDLPVSGNVALSNTTITGSARAPNIRANVNGSDLRVFKERILSLTTQIDVDTKHISISALQATLPNNAKVIADIDWFFKGKAVGRLGVRNLRFSNLQNLRDLDLGLAGHLRHLDLSIDGDLDVRKLSASGPNKTNTGGDILRWLTTQGIQTNGSIALWDLEYQTRNLGHLTLQWETLIREGTQNNDDLMCPGPHVTMLNALWLPEIPKSARTPFVRGTPTGETTIGDFEEDTEEKTVIGIRPVHPSYANVDLCIPMVPQGGDSVEASLTLRNFDIRGLVASYLETSVFAQKRALEVASFVQLIAPRIASKIELNNNARKAQRRGADPKAFLKRLRNLEREPLIRSKLPPPPLQESLNLWNSTTLTGTVFANLNRSSMEFTVDAELEKLALRILNQTFSNRDRIEASYDGHALKLGTFTLGSEDRYVALSGFASPNTVNLKLGGDLDLRIFNLAPTAVTDISGTANVDISVQGTRTKTRSFKGEDIWGPWTMQTKDGATASMTPIGEITFDNRTSFRVRSLGTTVNIEQGIIELQSDRIVLPERRPIRMSLLEGRMSISGSMMFQDYTPGAVELNVNAQNITYRVPGTMNITLGSNLTFKLGQLVNPVTQELASETWRITGDIDIVEGLFYKDIELVSVNSLSGAIGRGRVGRYEKSILEQLPFLQRIAFDLKLAGQNSFRVNMEAPPFDIDVEAGVDLRARKAHSDPLLGFSLTGSASILSGGEIVFQNRPFTIREGTASWKGDLTTPNISFAAAAEIPNTCSGLNDDQQTLSSVNATQNLIYSIVMTAEGDLADLNNFKVGYTSTPFVDARSIPFLLAFGCTADQFNTQAATDSFRDAAVSLALQPYINNFEKSLQDYIDLGDLSIGSSITNTYINLSKRVTNRFILEANGVLSTQNDPNQQSITARYLFTDNFFLKVGERQDATGTSGNGSLNVSVPIGKP